MNPPRPSRWQHWLATAHWPRWPRLRRHWHRLWSTNGGLLGVFIVVLGLYGVWLFTGMQALVHSPWLSPR